MTARLLQVLGVLFVLGLVGGAGAGLMVVKDRVRIVLSDEAVANGPDPIALLRDEVGTVARDLATLQQALGANFEALGNALEQRAAARHATVAGLPEAVAALQQQWHSQLVAVQAMQRQLQELPAVLATALPTPAATVASPPAATGQAAVEPAAVVVPPPEAAPVVAAPVAAPPPAPGGFLSFKLPTTKLGFTDLQDYVLLPELCRVGFDAKSTLHDFTGVTSQVTGRFRADFDDPDGAWTGEVVAAAATLVTGVEGRDTNMWEYLQAPQHPSIRFVVQRFVPAAGGLDVGQQTTRGDVVGTMSIRGKTREVKMPVHIRVDPQQRVVIEGQLPLRLSDYEVPVPNQLGLISMEDEVKVWIALRARSAGGKS